MSNKKILIVMTNVEKYATTNRATGLWLSELTHFYDKIHRAGYDVDFASPKGGYVPLDPHSLRFADETDWALYHDEDFRQKALATSLSVDTIDPSHYVAIYYTGGHGVMWDFPDNQALQKIAESIYQNGGYVTAVCHGVVGLLKLKAENGEPLIKGRHVTGFTNTEEALNRTTKFVPFLTETTLKSQGAQFTKRRFFSSHAVRDGRLITGQNPQSPADVADLLVKALEEN